MRDCVLCLGVFFWENMCGMILLKDFYFKVLNISKFFISKERKNAITLTGTWVADNGEKRN